MKIGLAGYSGAGVTTFLGLLSEDMELVHKHAGPEIRSVAVYDPRLEKLGDFFKPKKLTSLHVDIVELGDLRPEEGGGLRKETLNRSAGLDALVLVLRAFEAPLSDKCRQLPELSKEFETLMLEFAIADLIPVEKRLEHLGKEGKLASMEAQLLGRLKNHLEEGLPVRELELNKEELRILSGFNFMTLVPLMVVANLGAKQSEAFEYPDLAERCSCEGVSYMEVPVLTEFEILEIPEAERAPFLSDIGILEPARKRFIDAFFSQLRLVTFYTVSEKEIRAWSVTEGTPAVRAAGKVHTDMERGFIRAEVISVDDCIALGGMSSARDMGKLRIEGKEYKLQDGEIFQVRFNV